MAKHAAVVYPIHTYMHAYIHANIHTLHFGTILTVMPILQHLRTHWQVFSFKKPNTGISRLKT